MRRLPLFLQALGLVLATLLVVLVTTTVVVLTIPPPSPDVYTVADVAEAMRTARPTTTADGQPLEVTHRVSPPTSAERGGRVWFRNALAQLLRRSPDDIVVAQDERRLVAFGPGQRSRQSQSLAPGQPLLFGEFQVALRQPKAGWLIVSPPRPLIHPWQQRVLLVLGFAALAVTPLAWIFSRRMAAPIVAFAAAAERLGRNPDAPPLNVTGSSEVDIASAAFNQMQRRLTRYVEYRTAMVAAIAHDLRTPLTRLRFRAEAAPDVMRAKLVSDVDQMEAMIAATLAFVQDAHGPANRTLLDVASMMETVIDDATETGADAAVDSARRLVVEADPIALRRLLTDLVDNALKFGLRARCRVYAEDGMAVVEIDDNGPGVPEHEMERAFEPFQRLETSRSRETGGSGLGLAVVRAIARGHGGDVTLQNRPEGGLRARLAVPLAARVRRTEAAAA